MTAGLDGRAFTAEGIREVHRRFCDLATGRPALVLTLESTGERVHVVPGEYRTRDVEGRPAHSRQSRRGTALHGTLRGRLHQGSAGRTRSLPPRRHITGLPGFTRSSMAMAASCG